MEQVDEALDAADDGALLAALQLPSLRLRGVQSGHAPWYLEQLLEERHAREQVHTWTHTWITHTPEPWPCVTSDLCPQVQGCVDPLDADELQEAVTLANQEAQRATRGMSHLDTPGQTHECSAAGVKHSRPV